MEGALRLMDVPPDDIETWIAAQEKSDGKRVATAAALPPVPPPATSVHAALPPPLPAPLQGDVQ
jgi:cell division protein FtsI (penicillin-binding protein 3)